MTSRPAAADGFSVGLRSFGRSFWCGDQSAIFKNFPSRGVGAGVGSGAVGAGSGAGAGLGAGIGEAVSDGSAVPTLGGVGTYNTPGSPGTPGVAGGVGGLVGGAGAGGAAGLYTGRVTPGLGINPGGPGSGVRGHHDYEHLPENGALHIMMHVDGSGSILRTRKQLEIMKDTMLKEALLPYYDNDVSFLNGGDNVAPYLSVE